MFKLTQPTQLISNILDSKIQIQISTNPNIKAVLNHENLTESTFRSSCTKALSFLSAYPQLLSEILTILSCKYLTTLFSKPILTFIEANTAFSIIDLLASRSDFTISHLCLSFESSLIDTINACESLKDLVTWYTFLSKFQEYFNYKLEVAFTKVYIVFAQLFFRDIHSDRSNVIDLLRIFHFFRSKGFDLEAINKLLINFALEQITKMEDLEEYWIISEVLGAFEEIGIKDELGTIERFEKKYGRSKVNRENVVVTAIGENDKYAVREIFQFRMDKGEEFKDRTGNVKVEICDGFLNTKENLKVTVVKLERVGGDNEFKKEIGMLTRFERHQNLFKVFGFAAEKVADRGFLFVCMERYDKKRSLRYLKKRTEEKLNLLQFSKEVLGALNWLEERALCLRQITPKSIYYIDCQYKLSYISLLDIVQQSKFNDNFASNEFNKGILQGENILVNSLSSCVYSFGCILFYLLFSEVYTSKINLNQYFTAGQLNSKENQKFKKILENSIQPQPNSRPKFAQLLSIINE